MSEVKQILLVDDSRISRLMLKAIIESVRPSWKILEAKDASEALHQSEENEIDVITLDMNMPGTDGLTVAPKLQQNCPNATIALLTANFQDRVRTKAETQGLIFIPKPITEDKILDFIESLKS